MSTAVKDDAHVDYELLDLEVAKAAVLDGSLDIKITDAGRPTILDEDKWVPFRSSVNWSHI